jgi:uncharacterized membrane protein
MAKVTQNKTLKFLHVISSTGFCAALLSLLILHASLPETAEVEKFATLRITMGNVGKWLLLPSAALVLVSGLLSMALTDAFKSAGWVWAKLATGVLVFEGTLAAVQAPMERAARNAQLALEGEFDLGSLGTTLVSEWYSIWVIIGIAIVNIILGVYRPRFSRRQKS